MTRHHQPRKGSVAFSPRKRVARETPRVSTWPELDEAGLLAFAGYKVGMTHVTALDSRKVLNRKHGTFSSSYNIRGTTFSSVGN